jgi:nucleotide-binding universal stress UspA family protein
MSMFPTRILLATDASKEANLAARTAVAIAEKTGSELHTVLVGLSTAYIGIGPPEIADIPAPRQEELDEEAQRLLVDQVWQIEAAGGAVTRAHLRTGRPDEEIVALAEEISAGLIVVGSRGLGAIRRALMGSVSDSVVRHAHCPVLVVREDEEPVSSSSRILLATDGSAEAALSARTAADIADKFGSELHVVYVVHLLPMSSELSYVASRAYREAYEEAEQEAQRLLDEQVRMVQEAGGKVAQAHLVTGRPDEEVVRLSEELGAGLIALGSRGLGGLKRALMGSVSDSVVRHAHCPVLVMRKEKPYREESEEDMFLA